jgi:hypothetical protein
LLRQVKENKKKRIHAIKSQWRMKKKEDEQTAKQVHLSAQNLKPHCPFFATLTIAQYSCRVLGNHSIKLWARRR